MVDPKKKIYEMSVSEKQTIEIADRLNAGEHISQLRDIKGTCYLSDTLPTGEEIASCASFEKVRENKLSYEVRR